MMKRVFWGGRKTKIKNTVVQAHASVVASFVHFMFFVVNPFQSL